MDVRVEAMGIEQKTKLTMVDFRTNRYKLS